MKYKQSFEEVLADAKRAFEDIERSYWEKDKPRKDFIKNPRLKNVGFVDGTRAILVYR